MSSWRDQEHELQQPTKAQKSGVSIHSYVNRLVKSLTQQISSDSGAITRGLISHSFRRGAAQSANADSGLSTQWVLDRGGWSLTSLSKGFAYIVNTTQEDQKVAHLLSGWAKERDATLPSLAQFDSIVRDRVRTVFSAIFSSAHGYSASESPRRCSRGPHGDSTPVPSGHARPSAYLAVRPPRTRHCARPHGQCARVRLVVAGPARGHAHLSSRTAAVSDLVCEGNSCSAKRA